MDRITSYKEYLQRYRPMYYDDWKKMTEDEREEARCLSFLARLYFRRMEQQKKIVREFEEKHSSLKRSTPWWLPWWAQRLERGN